jgi:D-glycerate 3-kinase
MALRTLTAALDARVRDSRRVSEYYAPLAIACASRIEACTKRPLVLGIQGPQGCGKSTLATALVDAFCDVGLRGVSVSIDDFYLTHAEQRALAERNAKNPYLQYRGYPGTHDVALGTQVIDALRTLRPAQEALVPVYDKSAYGGRGDRTPRPDWRRVVGPLDVVIVEGWMLGFSETDAQLDPELSVPNALLGAYAAWNQRLGAFVHLDVGALDTIVGWRVDAERARRARGQAGLSDDEARDYILRFLPAYRLYVPRLHGHPPCEDVQTITLGEDRMPVKPRP